MKYFYLLLLAAAPLAFAIQPEIIFQKNYTELPVAPRVELSGIYGIHSFDVSGDAVWLQYYDRKEPQLFINGRSAARKASVQLPAPALSAPIDGKGFHRTAKVFTGERRETASGAGGRLSAERVDAVTNINGGSELSLTVSAPSGVLEYAVPFSGGDLAYGSLIGVDRQGYAYCVVELQVPDDPLRISRWVYVLHPDGGLVHRLRLPDITYLTMQQDLQIDAEGNLYHMLSEREGIKILKWAGLKNNMAAASAYPQEYDYALHYNSLVPTEDFSPARYAAPELPHATTNRREAVRYGEAYVTHQYYCSEGNITLSSVQGADGDMVKSPGWLLPGWNARVAYKWGGFQTLQEYDDGLAAGKYAGDIHTAGVSEYAVGVDCSGFVSRCWGLPEQYSTSIMHLVTEEYSTWQELRPGDAIHKVGHVRMFIDMMPNGEFRIVEASARDWAVSFWTYSPGQLANYKPLRFNEFEDKYSYDLVELTSVVCLDDQTIKLDWVNHGLPGQGYRLYESADGIDWTMIKDELELQDTTVTLPMPEEPRHYRVSVINHPFSGMAESEWSNIFTGWGRGGHSVLLVDGFDRRSGSWRGPQHPFPWKYGRAFASAGVSFDMAVNDWVLNGSVSLADYEAVFWLLGDESTIDETFSDAEQALVKQYLEGGGSLFVSGSEIGWDLGRSGFSSSSDLDFYTKYLKARYLADDSDSRNLAGVANGMYDGMLFFISQQYEEDYPDIITNSDGSELVMNYTSGTGAGVAFQGTFGSSTEEGHVVYFAFPLETTANDDSFDGAVHRTLAFFFDDITSVEDAAVPAVFQLAQNYPNPFNPSTTIGFTLAEAGMTTLRVHNVLGEEVWNSEPELLRAGEHRIHFIAAGLPAGVYFYTLRSGNNAATQKMLLLK